MENRKPNAQIKRGGAVGANRGRGGYAGRGGFRANGGRREDLSVEVPCFWHPAIMCNLNAYARTLGCSVRKTPGADSVTVSGKAQDQVNEILAILSCDLLQDFYPLAPSQVKFVLGGESPWFELADGAYDTTVQGYKRTGDCPLKMPAGAAWYLDKLDEESMIIIMGWNPVSMEAVRNDISECLTAAAAGTITRTCAAHTNVNVGDQVAEAMAQHETKIEKVRHEISSLTANILKNKGNKGIKLSDYELINEQRTVLRDKLQQLEAMKTTFNKSVCEWRAHAYTDDVMLQECKRLCAALPTYATRHEFVDLVTSNRAVVVVGGTGSGKSTQLVQYLADSPLSNGGPVLCTEPRAMSARALADRVSYERGTKLGQHIGIDVNGMHKRSNKTKVIFTTDALMSSRLSQNIQLDCSVLVIDEAHERTLETDLVLGFAKEALNKYPNMRLVVTSATIDHRMFSKFFGNCPVLNIPGTLFPVELKYTDTVSPWNMQPKEYCELTVSKCLEILRTDEREGRPEPRDVLVFMPAQDDCDKVKTALTRGIAAAHLRVKTESYCIHGGVDVDERLQVLAPATSGLVRVVVATNAAETSVTIDGVVHVVDTGLMKELLYDPLKGMEVLNQVPVPRTSADQRKGRAGRTRPGVCHRLYPQTFYESEMALYSKPEIKRRQISKMILYLKAKGVRRVEGFDFIERPEQDAFKSALRELCYLGALTEDEQLTEVGKHMSRMSTEPAISKMILVGIDLGVRTECLQLAAIMSQCSRMFLRFRNDAAKQEVSETEQLKLDQDGGDLINYLSLFRHYLSLSNNKKEWCYKGMINAKVMREAEEMLRSLTQELLLIKPDGSRDQVAQDTESEEEGPVDELQALDVNGQPIEISANKLSPQTQQLVCKAICAGFFFNVCRLDTDGRYYVMRLDDHAHMHPSSLPVTRTNPPNYMVYNTLAKTTRDYVRLVSEVKLEWIHEYAPEFFVDYKLGQAKGQLTTFVVGPLPSVLIKYVIGKNGENRDALKNNHHISIDITPPPEMCKVTCYASDKTRAERLINAKIEQYKRWSRLSAGVKTVKGLRFSFGQGGVVRGIEYDTPHEISIHDLPSRATYDEVREEIENILSKANRDYEVWDLTINADKTNAILTVNKDADRVADLLHGHIIRATRVTARVIPVGGRESGVSGLNTLSVSWALKEHSGTADVQLEQPVAADYVKQVYAKGRGHVWPSVCGVTVGMSVGRDYATKADLLDRLYVTKIPLHANEDDVAAELARSMPTLPRILSVKLRYNKSNTTAALLPPTNTGAAEQELDLFVTQLLSLFQQYGTLKAFDMSPDFLAGSVAYLTVEYKDTAEALAAQAGLAGPCELLGGKRLQIKFEPTCVLGLPGKPNDYGKIEKLLEDSIREVSQQHPRVITTGRGTLFRFKTKTKITTMPELDQAKTDLAAARACLKGLLNLKSMSTSLKIQAVYSVNDKSEAVVLLDKKFVVVCGSAQSVHEAMAQLAELSKKQKDDVVVPNNMQITHKMAVWYAKAGKVEIAAKFPHVKLHLTSQFNRQTVTFEGRQQDIDEVKTYMHETVTKLTHATSSNVLECVTCQTSTPQDSSGIICSCGHYSCRDCLELLCKREAQDLPVRCWQADGCESPFSYDELAHSNMLTPGTLSGLLEKSVDKYMAETGELGYCNECREGLYLKKAKNPVCFNCSLDLCAICGGARHAEGDYCPTEYKTLFNDFKKCPHCHKPVDKNGGCNAMLCPYCHGFYCWRCMRGFDRDAHFHFGDPRDPCYNHCFDIE